MDEPAAHVFLDAIASSLLARYPGLELEAADMDVQTSTNDEGQVVAATLVAEISIRRPRTKQPRTKRPRTKRPPEATP